MGGGVVSHLYETRVIAKVVLPVGEPLYSEMATQIALDDECGGEFVMVSQSALPDAGKIRLNPEEWPAVRAAIDEMMQLCRPKTP